MEMLQSGTQANKKKETLLFSMFQFSGEADANFTPTLTRTGSFHNCCYTANARKPGVRSKLFGSNLRDLPCASHPWNDYAVLT